MSVVVGVTAASPVRLPPDKVPEDRRGGISGGAGDEGGVAT